ncbi:MAG: ComF family protein [Magnetococcales bacterium]|nr:ComF family protein [Magnetococcales bacterium]
MAWPVSSWHNPGPGGSRNRFASGILPGGERLRQGWTLLLDFLLPHACPLCRCRVEAPFAPCPDCRKGLPPQPDTLCLRCGGPTVGPEQGCGQCLGNPMAPDAFHCAFDYADPVRGLIHGFKYGDHGEWAAGLGDLCWARTGAALAWEEPDALVPMPLHYVRLVQRRYNQSALLAGVLARYLDRPMVTAALRRVRRTTPQAGLNARQRRLNMQGAFVARQSLVAGRSLLLVDDVVTTGATMAAAVRALKQAGAARVAVVCLARAVPGGIHSSASEGDEHG